MHLEAIALPPDWDAQKDCCHFTGLLDPTPSYTEALWKHARFHHGNFLATVERVLHFAYARDATLTRIEPTCLTSLEKIETVLASVRGRPQVFADPQRLLEYLEACLFAEGERAGILREHRLGGELAWMYPIIELSDLIGGVEAELRDTISCEEEAHAKAHPRAREK